MRTILLRLILITLFGLAVGGPAYAAEPAGTATPAAGDTNGTATPAAPAASAPAATPAPAAPVGRVTQAQFTTDVQNLKPVNNITTLGNNVTKVYYFTTIEGLAGQTVTHRWEYKGKVMAEVHLKIGGDHWRVWSSKNLDPSWLGEWKASVVDQNGNTLAVNTLTYTAAPQPAAGEAQPATPAPSGIPAPGGSAQ